MICNEIKCHVNTSLGLVRGMHPLHPPLVSAPARSLYWLDQGLQTTAHEEILSSMKKLYLRKLLIW